MQAAKQLEAVREILRAISAMPFDLDGALRIVVERAADLCQADYGYVFVPAGDAYRLAAQHGGSPEQEQYERDHPSPVTRQTVVGRVVISGEPVQIEDVLSDPDYQWQEGQRLGEFRTLLGVPVRTQDRLVGVFGLARTSVRSFSEADIELVQTFADQAAIVIENVRLMGTIERQREELARYVPSTVAKLIANAEGEQLLAGHRREVSVVFCDLRGFTQFAEEAEPEEVLEILREYHREMGHIITEHRGTLEHYAGDGMMIFVNDPLPVPDHPLEATRMAVAMQARFAELSGQWHRQGFDLGLGIGVAVGFATLGRIGYEGHYGYAVIGTVANLASRLCSVAEPGQILISGRAYSRVEPNFDASSMGTLDLKGFRRPVEAFTLVGERQPA